MEDGNNKDMSALLVELTNEFLLQLGLDAEVTVEPMQSGERLYYHVKLIGENLSELVGFHGRNLDAAQTLLSLLAARRFSPTEPVRVTMEINDYRQKREEYLIKMAQSAAQEVRQSGEKFELAPMKPAERRIVHLALQDEADIDTESVGEGIDRRIVVKPRN